VNVSRKQMAEVHAALWHATRILCFVQQQMLKGTMRRDKLDTSHTPGDKLDTSHAPGDKLDTAHALGGNLVLCCGEFSARYAYIVNNV